MRSSTRTPVIPWVMLCAPFLLLAACYPTLPSDMPIMRDWTGYPMFWAVKSPIAAFRVPLMGLIAALVVAVMLSRTSAVESGERRTAYSGMFSTFLFTAALKADFEAMEVSVLAAPALLGPYARWFWAGTFASAVVGIGIALMRGQKVLRAFDSADWRLVTRDKIALVGLTVAYAAVAVLPVLGSHRAGGAP